MRVFRTIRAAAALALLGTALAAGVWLDVPFIRQESAEGCGAAALAMIQNYWRAHGAGVEPADPAKIHETYNSPDHSGIPSGSMAAYLNQAGFEAFVFPGEWADLEKHVTRGRPLIVALDGGRSLHYVVVAGVSADTVSLNDPADRKLRQYSRAEFDTKWSATQRWTLLAVPAASR